MRSKIYEEASSSKRKADDQNKLRILIAGGGIFGGLVLALAAKSGGSMESGCVTGDRINGLADGISGNWFTKFDLLTSAVNRGLPLTRTICRMELQDILVDAVGFEILSNRSKLWTSYKPLRRT
ncbi:Zeaxanthin epoxidase, chloroplastic [Melia azedarach]|uniref:Zeaxanthin epoxidase, chloroplastic n=1 Tax=Melia azedarach TaxID=155640 RepID=A0ACC1XLA7_MELAZ|nr:Zeaxanthin epoxidase, chloroplastic [Melia azedarach]